MSQTANILLPITGTQRALTTVISYTTNAIQLEFVEQSVIVNCVKSFLEVKVIKVSK